MNTHDLRDLHLRDDDIVVGPTARNKDLQGRKGKFIKYTDAVIEVDDEFVRITTGNVLKAPCPKCEPHN